LKNTWKDTEIPGWAETLAGDGRPIDNSAAINTIPMYFKAFMAVSFKGEIYPLDTIKRMKV
jgi:hypothetical protein